MKVLHVNYSDLGGAAIAMLRLNAALGTAGVNSECLVYYSKSGQKKSYCNSVALKKINGLENILISKLCGPSDPVIRSVNFFPTGLAKYLNECDADIIHLHWVNAEMMSIKEIGRIKKPIVWTLHDMWPFCGAEHYTMTTRYQEGYTRQNFNQTSPEFRRPLDLDRRVWSLKRKYWGSLDLHPVAVSHWLQGLARDSVLFRNLDVRVINNTLNLDVFRPCEKNVARNRYGLPKDKKIILFGSSGNGIGRKGFDLLKKSLVKVTSKFAGTIELVVFGVPLNENIAGLTTHWIGKVDGEEDLALLYNTADVMCVPSRQEAFGQTASEALACGVPVVAFNATGLRDIVDHHVNGYLAEPYNIDDFAEGLCFILETIDSREGVSDLCDNSRRKAEKMFAPTLIASQYSCLYSQMV